MKPLTYISLFSSAGVGCYGFKQNGFECIATNELLLKRLKIQGYNKKCRYQSGYIGGSILDSDVKSKLDKEINLWKSKHNIKEPDVIIATPPCQGMSVANHKKKDEKNRNSLVVESIKLIKENLPKFFVFENVRAFLKTICTDVDNIDKPIDDAINFNLGGDYNIESKILNFKEFGSNSSRTRTLVIGVRKDVQNITPYDIFPKKKQGKTLRQLIGDLPSLNEMGEISDDILHSYRKFDERMLPWIENLQEGKSAFENEEINRIPHRVIDGRVVFNKSKNGDKYARWYWDKTGPCIHTRNDILSSQNTVHPSDNRVFSIRELMRMMSIPESFNWFDEKMNELNELPFEDKVKFLKKEELNIRHCLGEAVPTGVFKSIANNIKKFSTNKIPSLNEIKILVETYNLDITENLLDFIDTNVNNYSIISLFHIAEHSNSKRQETSAYFTRQDIAFSVVKDLPVIKNKKSIKILEPSVGVGNFIPLLFKKYDSKQKVELDIFDIDNNSLEVLNLLISKLTVPENFSINVFNQDFLLSDLSKKYDIVIGNPPYKKLTNNKSLLAKYKKNLYNQTSNNLFSMFIERAIQIGNYVSLIVPKSLLNSPEFDKTRELLNLNDLQKICDYGEKGFKGVKIETISFLLKKGKTNSDSIIIESYITKEYSLKLKEYIFSNEYPYWLIYRNNLFDSIASKMNLDIFLSYRDRQITKKDLKSTGNTRVLKARNIGNNIIHDKINYDCYVDDVNKYSVSKYLNKENVVMVPNLTYYPRASFLPKDTIVDGSVALLTLKNGSRLPTNEDLDYYSTKDFEDYYRVARNHGTRSLNIDNNSVFFFGLLN
jgi:DNA (cytosine-5)-methyltransferase 1